ncbi:hypothetical protein [Sinomonas halotolerans]|uniref:Uncharacterized protein n=1 Tax=Sinomonas halotolerans TaxID=1644133 RepID=A0ABU9X3I2_9MICC
MQTSPAFIKAAAAWLLALVLVIVATVVAVVAVKTTVAGPEQPVRRYIAALEAGDGGRALGLLGAQVPAGSAALLDGGPLKDSMSRVEDISYATTSADDSSASVTVSYTVDGSRQEAVFPMERTGTDWLFFPRWSISPGTLPVLQATVVNSTHATINGAPVNMPAGRNAFPVFYPGSYVGSLPGKNFAAEPTAAIASGRDTQPTLNLATKATPQLVKAIDAKVREYLDSCARTATEQQRLQPDCPFVFPTDDRIQDGTISWKVSAYPPVTIEPFAGRWVVAPLEGKARLTATRIDLFTGATAPLEVQVPYSFSVRLTVGESAITVTPQLG